MRGAGAHPREGGHELPQRGTGVLAKVARDRIMVGLHEEYPAFGWNENKGYATSFHRDALRLAGPHRYHRTSWNLL